MVYYENDYRSKKEIEADKEQYVSNLIYRQEKEIKKITRENELLHEQIKFLINLLKETDSEYGKYLTLRDKYGVLIL